MGVQIFSETQGRDKWHDRYTKSIQIWSFSGPYFPVFGLNTGQKKLRVWTLFTQLMVQIQSIIKEVAKFLNIHRKTHVL